MRQEWTDGGSGARSREHGVDRHTTDLRFEPKQRKYDNILCKERDLPTGVAVRHFTLGFEL